MNILSFEFLEKMAKAGKMFVSIVIIEMMFLYFVYTLDTKTIERRQRYTSCMDTCKAEREKETANEKEDTETFKQCVYNCHQLLDYNPPKVDLSFDIPRKRRHEHHEP